MEHQFQKTTQDEYTLFFHMEGEKAERHGMSATCGRTMAAADENSTQALLTTSPASKRRFFGMNLMG